MHLEDLQDVAEAFLRVLAEANVDEADEVLKNYAYQRLSFRRSGKERNWESMLFDPMKGLKKFQTRSETCPEKFSSISF